MRNYPLLSSALLMAACTTASGPVTPSFTGMQGMLHAHNQVRAHHRLPALRWSPKLAAYSQDWANYLASNKACRMIHRSEAGKDFNQYGENLFWASPQTWSDGHREPQKVTAPEVARAWADEWVDYHFPSNTCRRGKQCGHYTQMIWRDTTQVGCAMTLCPDFAQVWVCSYDPPGNWIGQHPY